MPFLYGSELYGSLLISSIAILIISPFFKPVRSNLLIQVIISLVIGGLFGVGYADDQSNYKYSFYASGSGKWKETEYEKYQSLVRRDKLTRKETVWKKDDIIMASVPAGLSSIVILSLFCWLFNKRGLNRNDRPNAKEKYVKEFAKLNSHLNMGADQLYDLGHETFQNLENPISKEEFLKYI